MTTSKEIPFLGNFQNKIDSPRVPGQYNPDKQIRVTRPGKPVVEVTKGIMGTTRTGEHANEC